MIALLQNSSNFSINPYKPSASRRTKKYQRDESHERREGSQEFPKWLSYVAHGTAHTGFSGWLGLVGDAVLGSLWGPLGFESQWAPLVLSANFHCFHDVHRGWEAGGWVSLPSEGPCFILYRAHARNLGLPLESDSGGLKARQNPRSPRHGRAFLSPKEDPSGQGMGKVVGNQFLWQLEVSKEPQSPPI